MARLKSGQLGTWHCHVPKYMLYIWEKAF